MNKLIIIVILSLISTFNAAYLTVQAYGVKAKTAASSFCDFGETFSCSDVFAFDFAWIFGIPFPLIALFVYPIIIAVALLGYYKKIKNPFKILLALSIGGILFNSNIIYHEYGVGVYCLLCLMCTLIILSIGIMSYLELKKAKKG